MSPTIIKAGGSVLVDRDGYLLVSARARTESQSGPVWLVVSAAHGVTDVLAGEQAPREAATLRERHRRLQADPEAALDAGLDLELVHALSPTATRHDRLAWGERASARILAGHLGWPVVELGARLPEPLGNAIVPGFYFRRTDGELRTLPRGGSDITAVLLAHRLRSPQVRFWKAGGGIRDGKGGVRAAMPARELLEAIGSTIRPLHPATLRLAMRHGISFALEDPTGEAPATVVAP
ncbi:MAG: amino acid kinase family protein [Thermoplasmatota archaeon]